MPTRGLRAYSTMTLGSKVCSSYNDYIEAELLTDAISKLISGNAAIHNSVLSLFVTVYFNLRHFVTNGCACAAGKFLFALCEGNFCVGGKRGKKVGNGRLIISQLETDANDNTVCK